MSAIRKIIIIIAGIAACNILASLGTVLYLSAENKQIPDVATLGFKVGLGLVVIDVFLLTFVKNTD